MAEENTEAQSVMHTNLLAQKNMKKKSAEADKEAEANHYFRLQCLAAFSVVAVTAVTIAIAAVKLTAISAAPIAAHALLLTTALAATSPWLTIALVAAGAIGIFALASLLLCSRISRYSGYYNPSIFGPRIVPVVPVVPAVPYYGGGNVHRHGHGGNGVYIAPNSHHGHGGGFYGRNTRGHGVVHRGGQPHAHGGNSLGHTVSASGPSHGGSSHSHP